MTDTITRNGELAVPVPSGLHFLPHQREGITFAVNRLRTHRGAMFGDVMGLGKTIEAIGTANVLGPRRILVVCPASMLFTWWREIRTWQTLGLRVFLIQAGRDVADLAGQPKPIFEPVAATIDEPIGRCYNHRDPLKNSRPASKDPRHNK